MARAGVNYVQVTKAAEIIKAKGQEPTVDRIREQLGTGSKSTIGPLVKQWRSQHEVSGDVSGLPNDLVDIIKALYERIQQQAESTIEDMSSSHNEVISELNKALAAEKQANNQLTAQNEALTATANKNTDELELLRAQTIQYRADKEHADFTLVDLRQSLEEAKRESRAARVDLEHYQAKVAEDRQIERQQQQTLTQQFQEQVAQLSMQLSSVNTKLHEQQTLQNEQQKELNDALMQNQLTESELNNKSAALDELRAQLLANDEKYAQLLTNHELIQNAHDKVLANQSLTLKENEHLTKDLESKQTNIAKLEDRLSLLESDYRNLREEKSVLQGQFKQLQASL
jgi:chromosome segregation ATPase